MVDNSIPKTHSELNLFVFYAPASLRVFCEAARSRHGKKVQHTERATYMADALDACTRQDCACTLIRQAAFDARRRHEMHTKEADHHHG